MRFRIFVYAILILLIAIFQSTLLNYLKIYGVKPNLFIIFTITAALLRGNIEGATVGFFCGLSQDILTGKVIGVYALLGLYLGLLTGSVNKRLYRENILVIIFFTLVSTFTYEFIVYGCGILLPSALNGYSADISYALTDTIVPEAAYNSLAAVFVFLLMIKLSKKFDDIDEARKY